MPCWYTCPRCNGSGKETELVIKANYETEKRTVTCTYCSGRGEIRR